jgi:hypothetical protein
MNADLAGAPRWRGQSGRLEVWYATATDHATSTGVWVHHERIAPTHGEAYAHGWVALFPPGEPPVVERYEREPAPSATDAEDWFVSASASVGPGRFRGSGTAGAQWDLQWSGGERPMWTLPRRVWERELLPSAHVVVSPKATLRGEVHIGERQLDLDGIGAVAHIYGHGNGQRWGWLHADLDDETSLEIVSAVARRPGVRALPPLGFVQLRRGGVDWPRNPLLAAPLFRSKLSSPIWRVRGIVGRWRLTVTVTQPDDRCVWLDYNDPNGDGAVCTNTERADVDVRFEKWRGHWTTETEWSVRGTAHAELGTR